MCMYYVDKKVNAPFKGWLVFYEIEIAYRVL